MICLVPTMAEDEVRLSNLNGTFKRVLLAGFGLFAIGISTWELHGILFQPSLLALPFWVIQIGAWTVGGLFLAGGLWADDIDLAIGPGGISLSRRNPFRHRLAHLAREEITSISVRSVTWDSGPDTYVVDVRLARGPALTSGDYTTAAAAGHLADRLRQALG